jgi:hypothetical protein
MRFILTSALCYAAASVFGLDPETTRGMNLVLDRGYPLETYSVITSDGYIQQVFRIPHGKNKPEGGDKPVVFL